MNRRIRAAQSDRRPTEGNRNVTAERAHIQFPIHASGPPLESRVTVEAPDIPASLIGRKAVLALPRSRRSVLHARAICDAVPTRIAYADS